ncbi:RNA-binding protein 25 isoform X2 [Zea mays]|nr:RNA-binding protein 25 isoform X2 [Zea mays]AQK52302.1 splicing factor PWI domain-containing protein / RNA recognition motif (RRM)-containing protein [Zea mays]AQK52306.1 splicing factor PWI domain-containing protein / RNA recognition motif (RRM)-containing protein [Zea mays]AQK52310.1 splicing factor PWI domain-containing protein / RNA recognition motif (RRM)-containing protein [Zea mays]|eukprot:XP_008678563.1 RNA-binding protein 25 isoform X2 [Zea mays]
MPRYPAPYPMVRPGFVPRPMPPPGVVTIQRPPIISGIRAIPPLVALTARPPPPAVMLADKPPTAVYVGKIAPTVDNGFLLSLLQLCGPVKSWKRAEDPSNGKPKGFGFCEFESAEGILRATRLLNKLSLDGQELVININDATKEYLKKHVEEKKRAQVKSKDASGDGTTAVAENESSKSVPDESDKETGDAGDKDSDESTKKFGIVTDEDSQADKDVAEKISSMIEQWLKTRPPPPPPPVQPSADSSGVDKAKNDSADKTDADTVKRAVNETERSETASPDRRKDREHDKDKRDKDIERHDRERERERIRRDREKDHKHREVDRLYRDRLKEWESREREKEYQRYSEKEKEKDREHNRRREILKQEDESDEEDNRKRKRRSSSSLEDRKRRRQREKEEDLADKIREEEEIAEARRRAVELQQQADEAAAAAAAAAEESATLMEVDADDEKETDAQNEPSVVEADNIPSFANSVGAGGLGKENNSEEISMVPSHTKQNNNVPVKKLGFGLIGLGKRTSVPSVFAEEDDENNVDKSIRPLVPIDYNEELQAVQANSSTGANVAAAAEFAKRISVSNSKEEKADTEKDRNRRSSEGRPSDERREKLHDREKDKSKSENKKILDAKQLIDMIPRTKEELFAYDINWVIYDKNELHERMRPWISKKIIEFLGEEESTLVDYIVSCTKDHVQAEKMLELLQSILDVEAEMFVLKMWRMLIFEIKKVESGLSGRAK